MKNESRENLNREDLKLGIIIIGAATAAVIFGLFVSAILRVRWLNDQVETLNSKVETLQEETASAKETASTTESLLAEKIAENAVLQNSLDKAEEENETLEQKVEVYEDALAEISDISDRINESIESINDALNIER